MPGLVLKQRRGIWHAFGTVAGQRVRKSLGTRDRGQAEELRSLLEATLWKRHTYGEAAVRLFDDAALSYVEAGGEQRFLEPIVRHFRGRPLSGISPEEIRQAARLIYPGASPATWNRQAIVPARSIVNHAAGLGWCGKIAVGAFPVARKRRVAVGRGWIDAFLDQCDRDKLAGLAAAVLFMWQNGPRVSEAARVLPEHVDLKARTILLAKTKTDEWVTKHITRELAARIAVLPKEAGRPLFGYAGRFSIRNRVIAVCRRAGIAYVPSHQAGRHSFMSNTLAAGATLREAMDAGGFKTAKLALEIYAHSQDAGTKIADLFDTKLAPPKRRLKQVTGGKSKS